MSSSVATHDRLEVAENRSHQYFFRFEMFFLSVFFNTHHPSLLILCRKSMFPFLIPPTKPLIDRLFRWLGEAAFSGSNSWFASLNKARGRGAETRISSLSQSAPQVFSSSSRQQLNSPKTQQLKYVFPFRLIVLVRTKWRQDVWVHRGFLGEFAHNICRQLQNLWQTPGIQHESKQPGSFLKRSRQD